MKFQPPGAGLFFEAFVLAGKNKALDEFQTIELDGAQGRVMQSFVPVRDAQRLHVVCKTNELMKGSMIDVVVDGILRETYLHQKKHDRTISLQFDSGIYKSGKSLRRGKLVVHSHPTDIGSCSEAGQPKVGVIELRLHRAQTSEVAAKKNVPDPEETNSYQDLPLPWNSLKVAPDCDITLTGDEILNQSKRISCRRAFAQERPGNAPWSTLRFVYRSARRLREVGIMSEDDAESRHVSITFDAEIGRASDDEDDHSLVRTPRTLSIPGDLEDEEESSGASSKRKRDEVEDIVDDMTFGQHHGASNSFPSPYDTPSKRTRSEIENLEKEVRELVAFASQYRCRAEVVRAKLIERVRKRTEVDRRYNELLAQKEKAQKDIEKAKREETLYMSQLNNLEEND